jgi:hypothetical protein
MDNPIVERPKGGRALRIWLILGLAAFVPIYAYMLSIADRIGIDFKELSQVWLSFDAGRFAAYVARIADQGRLPAFASVYYWNCVSVLGYFAAFYSLSLLIARAIDPASRLHAAARVFPPISIVIVALSDLPSMRGWMAIFIGGSYAVRVILLYVLFLWFAAAAAIIALGRMRKRR